MMRDGRPRPAPPDSAPSDVTPAPGQLILLGCARLWQQGFAEALGDGSFLLNCLDALTLDEDLLVVRSKQATDRRFDAPKEGQVLFWTLTPLVFVPLALLAVGLGIGVVRMRRREAWQTEHGR
ncbi:MAG: hypothetical protein K8T90_10755 [Planctomycetes bacterium]|nr:hypothetical protein [Planctomycetota bacterium]